MCSTNVAFNMKTVENVIIFFSRIPSFDTFLEPIFSFIFHFIFVYVASLCAQYVIVCSRRHCVLNASLCAQYVIVCSIHTNIAFAVLMAPRRD